MVFCNTDDAIYYNMYVAVTILILIDGFLQFTNKKQKKAYKRVTILILIDGFLQ